MAQGMVGYGRGGGGSQKPGPEEVQTRWGRVHGQVWNVHRAQGGWAAFWCWVVKLRWEAGSERMPACYMQ